MNLNKKYILSLFLFCTATTLPFSLSQAPVSNLYATAKDISLKQIAGALIIMVGIKCLARLLHMQFTWTVFGLKDDNPIACLKFGTEDFSPNLNKKTTESYIKKYPFIIRIVLKLFLFINHKSTQHLYVSYIQEICRAEKYKDMQSVVQFLFDSGINPRFSPSYQQGLLTTACLNEDSQELVEYLLTKLKLDSNDRDRKTKYESVGYAEYGPCIRDAADPLSVASYRNNTQAVNLLINHNTHTHPFLDLDPMGSPPIEQAMLHNNTEMFKNLFVYTISKTNPTFIHKLWLLKYTTEHKDLHNIIANNFLNLVKKNNSLLESCFTCDDTIWLPHNYNLYKQHHHLYSGRIEPPHRMDKDASITDKDWWMTIEIKNEDKKRIPKLQTQVKQFLSRLQITC